MTDFNSLPLADQLKALQVGDELHLRGGGWLPFVRYGKKAPEKIQSGRMIWYEHGGYFGVSEDGLDIIRVVRPTERKVPEVVNILRAYATEISCEDSLTQVFEALADHFEKETP